MKKPFALIATALTTALVIFGLTWPSIGQDYKRVVPLLETTTTNQGQPLVYPTDGPAKITSLIVTLKPGEETGLHQHPILTYGHVLSGEIQVNYQGQGTKTYRAGDTFMEAFGTLHNGRNSGDEPARILVVFMGTDDLPNVVWPE
ncbi:MAG: cupin domain-containing protein [Pseudomonadota bacterium]